MTDEKMPDWMTEEQGGEHCDVDIPETDHVPDKDIDHLVLTAAASGPEEEEARLREYAQLFPAEAVGIRKEPGT